MGKQQRGQKLKNTAGKYVDPTMLLDRTEFKRLVFNRDGGRCVVCKMDAVDAHHLIPRKDFIDGGYFLNNGVALCAVCHTLAESQELSAAGLRVYAGLAPVLEQKHE